MREDGHHPHLALRLEPTVGTDIREACCSAVAVAETLQVLVTFKFNGRHVVVWPGDDPQAVAEGYRANRWAAERREREEKGGR